MLGVLLNTGQQTDALAGHPSKHIHIEEASSNVLNHSCSSVPVCMKERLLLCVKQFATLV